MADWLATQDAIQRGSGCVTLCHLDCSLDQFSHISVIDHVRGIVRMMAILLESREQLKASILHTAWALAIGLRKKRRLTSLAGFASIASNIPLSEHRVQNLML